MSCPECGHENPTGSKFCLQCGTGLKTRCAQCDSELPAEAKFCNECGNPVTQIRNGEGPASPQSPAPSPRPRTPRYLADKILSTRAALEGERKQVTVLFADVKGSMELAEEMDPEEWAGIMQRFFRILSEGVERFEGFVDKFTGDGIMALFGAPIAHEDHARRACYAALHLRDQLRQYADQLRRDRGLNFSVRMGLHSGEVVVGKIGDDLRMDYTAQGHTVGLAQRMEQLAAPDRVYATEYTIKLVEGLFRFGDLGDFKVKGAQAPVRVYELKGVGPLRSRMDVAVRRGLVRFVGRRQEMEQLNRAWQSVLQAHGQIVAVTGEAGVGKSRLFYEFKIPLQSQCLLLEAFSVSHGKAYAYLPLIDLLKSYFRITLEDDERTRREKVGGKILMLDRTLEPTLPYVFSLLGITDPDSSLQRMDAQIRRQRTMDAVKRLLVRETLNQPLVLIFEDLHWIDGETQAFLDLLTDAVGTSRLLLLVNYRPEYRYGWGSKSCSTQLGLHPLGGEDARELLTALLGDGLEPLKGMILEKTEGNPFFMEEVVQTLAEEGVLRGERGHYRLEKAAAELHVPTTVQGVLAARIDRLPEREKRLLQTLAVIGKEFTLGLVARTTEQAEGELHPLLQHLQAGEYVYEQPAFPEPEYAFKHALTQEVAYGSVLIERRKVLHERTARAIESLHRNNLEEHYGELAHHYSRTDNTAKAVEYLRLAGQQAMDRSAYEEGIGEATKALKLLQGMPEGPERDRQELRLQALMVPGLMATKGWLSNEAEAAYRRIQELGEQLGETVELVHGLGGLLAFCMMRGEFDAALELGRRMLDLAQDADDPDMFCVAHTYLGEALLWFGDLVAAKGHFEAAMTVYDPQKSRRLRSLYYAADPGQACLSYLGWILLRLGYPDQAREQNQKALSLAQELAHPYTVCSALSMDGYLQLWLGDLQAAQDRAAALAALADEHAFPDWLLWATCVRARALAEQDEQLEEAVAETDQAIEVYRAMGAQLGQAGLVVGLAEAQMRLGQTEQALARVAEALDVLGKTGEHLPESELYKLKGEIHLTRSEDKQAEACFHQAIDVARGQAARLVELHAVISLARLWQKHGKKEEAHRMLAEIYGWFTEGLDTRYLKEAKALLEELA